MPHAPPFVQPGEFAHVILRGVRGMEIVRDDEDRSALLRRLGIASCRRGVRLVAWSLMSNHAHLLAVRSATPIHRYVHSFASPYAREFNRRHGERGHVFQDRFRRVPIRSQEQLLTCMRYVHLNPVVAGLVTDVDALGRYPWTGHSALLGGRAHAFQDVRRVLGMFGDDVRTARERLVRFTAAGVSDGPDW